MTSHIVLTKSSGKYSGVVVTIFTKTVDETFTKTLTTISPPQTSAKFDSGPKDTKIVDLIRVIHRFEIDGYLTATEGTFGQDDYYYNEDTSALVAASTALLKKTALIQMIKSGGTFTMAYAGTNYTVNVEKQSIKEVPEDTTNALTFDIKVSLIEGVNV